MENQLTQDAKDMSIPTHVRLSRFCHVYRKDDIIALFHTLNVRTIFLKIDEDNTLIKSLCNGDEVSTNHIDAEEKQIIRELIDAGVVLEEEQTDRDILEQLRKEYTGTVDISIMYLLLTDKCNLACKYCFIEGAIPADNVFELMSEETAKKAVDLFIRKAHLCEDPEHKLSIIFYGGEPTLNWETLQSSVLYIQQKISNGDLPSKTEITLITNGTLLNQERVAFIKAQDVRLSISCDGPGHYNDGRLFHDGRKSIDRVMQSFDLLREADIPISVSCTISSFNNKNIREIAQWLCDEKVISVGFNLPMCVPNQPLPSDTMIKDAAIALTDCYEVFRQHSIYEDRVGRKIDAFAQTHIYPFDCGGCGGQIVIAPDGQVGICHAYLGERKFFDFNVHDTKDVDLSNHPDFVEWSKRSPLNMPQCYDCPVLGICGGGCAKNAEVQTGSIWELDHHFCIYAKHTLEWMIWDLYKITSSSTEPSMV